MRGDPAITVCTCGPWRSDAWEWAAWRKERAEIVGWGTTEHEAMDDLLRKLKEADNERGAALVSDERRRVLMIPQEEWDRRHGIKAADGRANLSSPGSVIPDEAVGKPVAWRWRIIGGDMWVHWGTEPVVGVNLSDETVIGRDVEVQPLYASPTSPPREEDIRVINADHTRLTACLLAMSEAGPNVTAEALRSVAYDAVMNLIPADVAEHQLNARSTSPPREEIVEALREIWIAMTSASPSPVSLEEIVEVLTTVLPLVEQAEFLESCAFSYGGDHMQPAEWGISVEYQQSKDAMPGAMFAADVERFHKDNRDEDEGDGRFLTEANKLRSLLDRLSNKGEE